MGETDDELSEIDDNEISEADMSNKSHETDEWWWVINDDELDEISDLWGWRLIEADLQITIVILNIIWFVGIFSNLINYWLKCFHNIFHLYINKRVQIKVYL